jgi:hypothetical protein
MMEEILIFALVLPGSIIVIPWLAFALAALFEGFPRLRLHQILGMVGVAAWVCGFIVSLDSGEQAAILTLVTVLVVLLVFAGMWRREFGLLMLRSADEFPDRSDKLAWIFVLTVMAPAGVWTFRSYRKARWPAAGAVKPPHPLDPSESFEDAEMDRVGA